MRICMLTSFFFPTIGGVEAHVFNLSKSLIKKTHDIVIVHPLIESHPEGRNVVIEDYHGLEVHKLYLLNKGKKLNNFQNLTNDNSLSFLMGFYKKARPNFYAQNVIRYIKKLHLSGKIDILHQHDFIANIISTKVLSKIIPVIITNHTGEFLMINNHTWTRPSLKYILSHYKHLIAPSQELCNVPFMKLKGKASYIPNGVSIDNFTVVSPNKQILIKEQLGFKATDVLILCARRWAPTKGVKYFVESIPKVLEASRDKGKEIRFLISGNDYEGYPRYKESIISFIKQNKLDNHITLLGDIPHHQIQKYYQASDIVVLPSLMEATSLSGLEAMSCGKPLIGTEVGGIPEIIDNFKTGLLIKPKSSKEISESIIKLINNKKARDEFGTNARTKVENEFSWDIVADKTIQVYSSVLKGNSI
jgi:glycosyltransferase involved in cell wall biosynthesis